VPDKKTNQKGILFIVSTPIGNYRDITLRALDILNSADIIIGEEYRQTTTLLKKIGVDNFHILTLNEHNEIEQTPEIIRMLLSGNKMALISDCGTPAFADPGTKLISRCVELGINVKPVPGPSSLMAAVSLSPIAMEEFHFVGFLPRKTKERQSKIAELKKSKLPLILMDTPYRMEKLVQEIAQHLGKGRRLMLAVDLTKPKESVFYGPADDILPNIKGQKAEFVLIVYP